MIKYSRTSICWINSSPGLIKSSHKIVLVWCFNLHNAAMWWYMMCVVVFRGGFIVQLSFFYTWNNENPKVSCSILLGITDVVRSCIDMNSFSLSLSLPLSFYLSLSCICWIWSWIMTYNDTYLYYLVQAIFINLFKDIFVWKVSEQHKKLKPCRRRINRMTNHDVYYM